MIKKYIIYTLDENDIPLYITEIKFLGILIYYKEVSSIQINDINKFKIQNTNIKKIGYETKNKSKSID